MYEVGDIVKYKGGKNVLLGIIFTKRIKKYSVRYSYEEGTHDDVIYDSIKELCDSWEMV